ncbi:MAG TPA: ABC transporter permease subunit [Ideonella sp.]|uniref:PhnE/PtxC family ABC transporter permease n=1 Tax=Ideonella sp. TaxID=1929293 RepID=UPI002E32C446|nr:ABC transporter permease subunit [Ideonella sp.]HEX5683959.1 ABC transporter permease subunit [Ideonella sp.]
MNATDRRAEWRRFALWAAIALSAVVATEYVGADPTKLADREGLANAMDIVSGFANPDLSAEFVQRIGMLSLESLFVGIMGTVLAVVIGGVLALATIRVPDLPQPPKTAPAPKRYAFEAVRTVGRWILAFFRSIPEIVWAYIFVRLFGLGVIPAILAIGLTVGGSIGKLYSELAESVDPRTVLAMRAMGANRLAILLFSVIPQVSRQWIAYALFRLECNIRSGTILGVVGAGGLGAEIALAIRYFQYDKLATALIAVLIFVIALEMVSAWLRKSPSRYTFMAAGLSTAAALSFLDISWHDLLNPSGAMLVTDSVPLQWDFIRTASSQVLDTLAMAWVATVVSAVVAFVLAPLAANQLTTGSYLPDPVRTRGLSGLLLSGTKWCSRWFLQITRAMPELTLALVFVVWVGAGPLGGILAIAVHNAGVLGRLYSDVLEEVESGPPAALQAMGAGRMAVFLFGVLPQVRARLAAFTLYRFEVNVRATAMVGFVGAGGIGDALNTAISLFHLQDLTLLLITMVALVTVVDTVGDRIRARILRSDHGHNTQQSGSTASEAALEDKAVPPRPFPIEYGGVLVAIERVVEATRERLVVQTSQEVPEGLCLTLAPRDSTPMPATNAPTVTARRVADVGATHHVYELTPCDGDDATQWAHAGDSAWHLHSAPAPLAAVPQSN